MKEKEVVKTPLQIVYRKGNDLSVKDSFDEENKNEIWGILLQNGVILSIDYYENLYPIYAKKLVQELTFNNKHGTLPKVEQMEEYVKQYGFLDYAKTIAIIKNNGVDTKIYMGLCWCENVWEKQPEWSCCFDSITGKAYWTREFICFDDTRLAVIF